jgi:hypothetical protein
VRPSRGRRMQLASRRSCYVRVWAATMGVARLSRQLPACICGPQWACRASVTAGSCACGARTAWVRGHGAPAAALRTSRPGLLCPNDRPHARMAQPAQWVTFAGRL